MPKRAMPPCLAPQRVREAWEVMGTKARLPSSASMLVCPSRSGATARLPWHCPQGLCSPLGAGPSARLPPDRQGREPEGHADPWVARCQLGGLRVKPAQDCAAPFPRAVPAAGGALGTPTPQGPQGEPRICRRMRSSKGSLEGVPGIRPGEQAVCRGFQPHLRNRR